MKTRYILTLALGAMTAFACNKAEIDDVEDIQGGETEDIYEIKAEIVNTKTAYDELGHFSWVENEKVSVVCYNDGSDPSKADVNHNTYTNNTGAGTTATFAGGAFSSPWVEEGLALYPSYYSNNGANTELKETGGTHGNIQVTKKQEITPDLDHPLAAIPLIGRKNSSGIYQFKTAVGILKVTVTDIPSNARYLYLVDPNNTYSFSGKFNLGGLDEISEANAVYSSSNDYKTTISFTPQAAHETRTFYIPVPTGTIPVGTMLKLDTGSSVNIMTKTFTKTVTVTANHVTPLATVAAETWNDVSGTGKFYDNNGFYVTSSYNTPVNVTIQQNASDPTRYRVVNPYQAYITAASLTPAGGLQGPDPHFYFTLKDGYVDFENYNAGLEYNIRFGSGNGEFVIVHPETAGVNNKWNNVIIKADGSGNPLNIQLAPVYKYNNNASMVNTMENPKIEIVFPGSTPMLTIANYANNGQAVCAAGEVTATLGANVSAIKAVAATDLASGVAALKAESAGMLTFTASGVQYFDGLAEGTYRLVYKVETDGHGFTFKDGGVFVTSPLEAGQMRLYPAMITVNSDTTYGAYCYDGGGKKALVDGDVNMHWHSAYNSYDGDDYDWATAFDPTYGICIDIALPSAVSAFHLSYYVRSASNANRPVEIKYAGSNDGSTWTEIGTIANDDMNDAAAGDRVDLPNVNIGTSYSHLRIGITKSGDGPYDLTVSKGGHTALGEILLFDDSI